MDANTVSSTNGLVLSSFFFLLSGLMCTVVPGRAQKPKPLPELVRPQVKLDVHSFWNKTNLALFAGVAATRALDYSSTRHFRARGRNETLLTNDIVDNKPLFIGIEVAGTAASLGLSYWLHKTQHHPLERRVSIIHINLGTTGNINNYRLGRR